jgi:hypothetical protein
MEVDDFVETSDVEELEEEDRRALSSSRQRHSSFSPRKRVKVRLFVCVSSLPAYISSKLYHGSPDDDETIHPDSRSRSSSTTLKPTSPVWLPSCSMSQPSDADFQSNTPQDPLLYSPMHTLLSPPTSPVASILLTKRTSLSSSSEQDQIAVTSTTPTNSPPTHLYCLSSPELHSPPKSPIFTRNLLNDDNDNELLHFTPVESDDLDRTLSLSTPSIETLFMIYLNHPSKIFLLYPLPLDHHYKLFHHLQKLLNPLK